MKIINGDSVQILLLFLVFFLADVLFVLILHVNYYSR